MQRVRGRTASQQFIVTVDLTWNDMTCSISEVEVDEHVSERLEASLRQFAALISQRLGSMYEKESIDQMLLKMSN